jgi:hypothetical protein
MAVKKYVPWIFAAAGVAGCIITIVIVNANPGEPLTLERLQAAQERWKQRRAADYDLRVEVRGAQKGDHEIQVRGGKVVRMTTGGFDVPQNAWTYWSVDGMLQFLQMELQNAERPELGFGVKDRKDVVMFARFDPDYGYPREYLRHVMGRSIEIRWEIISFEPRAMPR